jgi:hypothetical protein
MKTSLGLRWAVVYLPVFALTCMTDAASSGYQEGGMSLAEIAKANSQGISAIRSFVLEGKLEREIEGPSPVPRHLSHRFTWIRQDGEVKMVEREVSGEVGNREAGDPIDYVWRHRQFSNGVKGYRELVNRDPDDPPSLTEIDPRRARGVVRPTQAKPYGGLNPPAMCLFAIGGRFHEQTLSQLVADKSNASAIRERPSQANRYCYVLEVMVPSLKKRHMIWVDSKANHLIRKVESFDDGGNLDSRSEVGSFHQADSGLFFPKTVTIETHLGTGASRVRFATYLETTMKQVNEKLPPETLEVKFPEGLRVTDLGTGEVHLWGKDGPRRTFKNRIGSTSQGAMEH